ncbi:MAG TPA: hypothetical protein P5280_07730 [Cyclobacteriaceae bacterium]|nr:hypothetical protein [Cyclobacteriaceae bacterium]
MRTLLLIAFALLLSACSRHNYHTVKAKKPRYHHTWYKDHKWHKKLQVGRIRIKWFERQGTKTVKMKG